MDEEVGAWDSVLLDPLTQESFIANLNQRFKRDLIYTYIGNMLVSINPQKQLFGYCKELIKAYASRGPYQLPPHIFGVAGSAWRLLRDGGDDQVLVLTGECGAGKSEAARAVLTFLSHAYMHAAPALACILHADLVLQAFGHSHTAHNHNSSRFGKYLDVEFDFKGEPLGGNVTGYLLEKSRVTNRLATDRNFHIFYQLVCGADIHLLKLLKLHRNVDKYALLSNAPPNCRRDDKADFLQTKNGLEVVGLSWDECVLVFRIVAAVLKLGNLVLLPTTNIDGTEACTISNDYEVYETCELLGVESTALMQLLTCRVEVIEECTVSTGLSCGAAAAARDALCRALYARLFTYLVNRINQVAKVHRRGKRKLLGILDLYGSEALERNGFEQLVINVCEEKLHHVVMTAVLKDEQEEYAREGIDWQPILLHQPICDATLHHQLEVLALLDDPSCSSCDESYYSRVTSTCVKRPHTDHRMNHMPAHCFRLQHFLGPVTYNASGFCERNRDGVGREVSRVMYTSQHPLLPALFPEGHPALPQGPGAASTSAQCRLAMCALTRTLQTKEPHYIRCLRPNSQQLPRVFDVAFVNHQIVCFGLVETARVRRQGFCYKQDVTVFLERYKMLSSATWPRWCRGSSRDGVVLLLRDLPIPSGEFAFGRSKIFVRSPRTVYELEEFRRARLHDLAVLIQKTWRCHRVRSHFLRMRTSQQIIVSAWRSWRECRMGIPFEGRRHLWCLYRIAREEYRVVKRRHQVEWAVSVIQKYFIRWKRRCYLLRLAVAVSNKEMESPICHVWPLQETRQPRLADTSSLLKRLHHKWRCHKYRISFDQTARNRMREKVTASIIFRDRKASYTRSVSHPFLGDYVRLRQNMQWKRLAAETHDQYVVFADLVHKVARSSGKLVPALLVLSTSAMLLLDQRTLQIKSRVPAHEIYRLSLSPYLDGVAVFHIKAPCMTVAEGSDGAPGGCLFQGEMGRKKGDLVFQTGHVIEVVTKLFLVVQNAAGKPPEVNITTDLEANFGQQTVMVSFRCVGVPEVPPGQVRILRKGAKMDVLV